MRTGWWQRRSTCPVLSSPLHIILRSSMSKWRVFARIPAIHSEGICLVRPSTRCRRDRVSATPPLVSVILYYSSHYDALTCRNAADSCELVQEHVPDILGRSSASSAVRQPKTAPDPTSARTISISITHTYISLETWKHRPSRAGTAHFRSCADVTGVASTLRDYSRETGCVTSTR